MCLKQKKSKYREKGFQIEDYLEQTSKGEILNVSIEKYTKERVRDQIGWYDESAIEYKKKYQFCKIWILVCSALIPVVAACGQKLDMDIQVWINSFIGFSIIVVTGILDLCQLHEKSISYRRTAEELKREFILFSTTGISENMTPEEKNDHFKEFVKHFETIVDCENRNWQKSSYKSKDHSTAEDKTK